MKCCTNCSGVGTTTGESKAHESLVPKKSSEYSGPWISCDQLDRGKTSTGDAVSEPADDNPEHNE